MKQSAYTDKEWVEELNKAINYARRFTEVDGSWIGSLRDLMTEYTKTHPLRVAGPSIAAMLPLTHLVQSAGRKDGSVIWIFKDGVITLDDWKRISYLRRQEKQASAKRKREARSHPVTQAVRATVERTIDESITGHPEVVEHSVVDVQQLRDEVKSLREKLQTVTGREDITRELYKETSKALVEKERRLKELETILEMVMSNPQAPEIDAFRLGFLFARRGQEERNAESV